MTGTLDPPDLQTTELADWVVEEFGRPVDRWAVAAQLESRGLRDVDARERYGDADLFALADRVHDAVVAGIAARGLPPRAQQDDVRWYRRSVRGLTLYVRGAFVALPMAIQVLAMLVLGYALWSYLSFDESQASAVSVGTILSFVVTGGFVQTIGRLGLSYAAADAHRLAERACRRVALWGALAAAVVGTGLWAVNVFTAWFPQWVAGLALVYYALLCALWLVLAVLYTVQHRAGITVTIVLGIGGVWVMQRFTTAGIYVSHWVGLGVSVIVAALWGGIVLRRRARRTPAELADAAMPPLAIVLYDVGPYFLYGTLYFLLLFLDRLVAWTTGDFRLPLLVWFRTPYELGLDWALLSLVLTIAVLEYSSRAFADRLLRVQQRTPAGDRAGHNRSYVRFYRRQAALLAVVSVCSITVVYRLVLAGKRFDDVQQARDFFASPITFQVFALGAVAYALLAVALLNVSFFFTLSRPWLALRPIAAGLALGFAVGYLGSRIVDYWWGGLGLLAAMATFALLTTRHVRRFMRSLDAVYAAAQ